MLLASGIILIAQLASPVDLILQHGSPCQVEHSTFFSVKETSAETEGRFRVTALARKAEEDSLTWALVADCPNPDAELQILFQSEELALEWQSRVLAGAAELGDTLNLDGLYFPESEVVIASITHAPEAFCTCELKAG